MSIICIIMRNMDLKNEFENADHAFEYFNEVIRNTGVKFGDTKALFNIGFEIQNPMDNHITHRDRAWNYDYAQAEWLWYLSGDPSLEKLGEIYGRVPKIWKKMANSAGRVMSNYGWQWNRDYQLDIVVNKLKDNPETRQASLSIFDGKEFVKYQYDTPCTYAIHFYIVDNKLNMSVMMRSNDLWYGFCNDQYCFSMLQKMVSDRLNIETGTYYHFANNLHLYNDKL